VREQRKKEKAWKKEKVIEEFEMKGEMKTGKDREKGRQRDLPEKKRKSWKTKKRKWKKSLRVRQWRELMELKMTDTKTCKG
jgi:hypothetical protein